MVIRFSAWDNWELVEEYSSSLNVVTGYLQGATGVIKSWGSSGTVYYYQDKLGSTTHVANASGQLVESYKYDLYGTPSYFSSTVGVADLYAGERWIPELALYDLRNRFMSPELGRFLQADPIGFKGDASNLYRYCGNDPVDRTDPDGLLDMWGNLTNFFNGNPSMNLIRDAWNQQRFGGLTMAYRNDSSQGQQGGKKEGVRENQGFMEQVGEYVHSPEFETAVQMSLPAGRGAGLFKGLFGKIFGKSTAKEAVTEGTKVFRVWGDEAAAMRPSWATIAPRTVRNFRNVAGLSARNSGRFMSEGVLTNNRGVTTRGALTLDGNAGGLFEVVVPKPTLQIRLQNVQGLNPEF